MSDLESAQLIAIERGDKLIKANSEIMHLREVNAELLKACKSVRTWIMEPFTAEDADSESLNPYFRKALRAVNEAIAKAEPK